ncbi:MAG: HAD family hydrolase [Rhodobacteraceae bacterium]|nr:HAD family hydrolase [Paracoccaceae bacterium]
MPDFGRARAILFDKDGTLFDFQKSWGPLGAQVIGELSEGDAEMAAALAEAGGYDLASERYLPGSPLVSGSADKIAEAWAALLPGREAADLEWWLNDQAEAASEASMATAVADLPGLLARLAAAGMALGVATHDGEAPARRHLAQAGALSAFGFISGYDSGYPPKPAPEVLRAFAHSAGVAVESVVMVGDSLLDLRLAHTSGALAAVGVLTGPAEEELLATEADVILPDIGGLPEILRI